MITTLYLPDFAPTSLNSIQGHWAKRHKVKAADRELVKHCAQGLPMAERKRRVQLFVTLTKGMKRLDNDNAWKSLLDALKHAKLLVDDSPNWCIPVNPVDWSRGEKLVTFVVLEDVE